jgi:hypothetical protein
MRHYVVSSKQKGQCGGQPPPALGLISRSKRRFKSDRISPCAILGMAR